MMSLPILNENNHDFYKTLHQDALLVTDEHGLKYDLVFENGDIVMCTGYDNLANAVMIAIMVRFQELQRLVLYEDFGCKVHSNVKRNKSNLTLRKIRTESEEVLRQMRRIKKINYLEVKDNLEQGYIVEFSVTSITDEVVDGSVNI